MRRQKKVLYFVSLILALLIFSRQTPRKPDENNVITPAPTGLQSTIVPTSVLGVTNIPASPSAILETRTTATVVKVVDGDTVQVTINGVRETIRILGIDTPETVDPRRPVECFGKEASDKAKALLPIGKMVELEQDYSQSNRDRYGRLLRYVSIDGKDYGKQMIEEGYAYEYTYDIPYKLQVSYKSAQHEAQENKRGLWAIGTCPATMQSIRNDLDHLKLCKVHI